MLNILPSAEQTALIDAVAGFLQREMPVARLRPSAASASASVTDGWASFAHLGWLSLGLSEAVGGAGYGPVEEALVFREFGRFLLTPALLASVVAAHMIGDGGSDLLDKIMSGDTRVGLANPLTGPDGAARGFHLIDCHQAHWVLAQDERELAIYAVDAFGAREAVPSMDPGITLARCYLDPGARALLRTSAESPAGWRAGMLLASLQAGIAGAARDMAVAYAKVREQFGQPIGAFQAIKHKCADMAVYAEAAAHQSAMAALALAANDEDCAFQVAAGRVVSCKAAIDNAEENIQIHGGMGFTVECDAHLYLKRAHLYGHLIGGTRGAQAGLLAQAA